MSSLKPLFDKYGCDKSYKHRYHLVYDKLMSPKKDEKINFLEIGVWKGASTRAFADYFKNGTIYGVDIFTRVTLDSVEIGNRNIKLMQGDSTSPISGNQLAEKWPNVEFDFILDDGAHHPQANMLSFRHFHRFVKPGGMYIIEDVWPLELMSLNDLAHPWLNRHQDRYNVFKNVAFLQELDDSGWEIDRHDLREMSGEPDSYIITLKRPE